jgi:hypothetical protein
VRGFLNARSANEIVFVRGATEAINLVAQSWGMVNIGKGDEILITWLEHQANIIPWQQLAEDPPGGSRHQGTAISDQGYMPNIEAATTRDLEREQINLIQDLNHNLAVGSGAPDAVDGVIKSYELAFRMQDTVPGLLDISKEPRKVLDAYGAKPGLDGSFARQCLMARRLSEAGVGLSKSASADGTITPISTTA